MACDKLRKNSVNILVLKEYINQIAYLINYLQNTCHCGFHMRIKVMFMIWVSFLSKVKDSHISSLSADLESLLHEAVSAIFMLKHAE